MKASHFLTQGFLLHFLLFFASFAQEAVVTIDTVINSDAEALDWATSQALIYSTPCFECSDTWPKFLALDDNLSHYRSALASPARTLESFLQWKYPQCAEFDYATLTFTTNGDQRSNVLFVNDDDTLRGENDYAVTGYNSVTLLETTSCTFRCKENFRVEDNICVACPIGTTNEAGDNPANSKTWCDHPVYSIGELNSVCTSVDLVIFSEEECYDAFDALGIVYTTLRISVNDDQPNGCSYDMADVVLNNAEVLPQSTGSPSPNHRPICRREPLPENECDIPSTFCNGEDAILFKSDCDNDKLDDHICVDADGNMGVVETSNNCQSTWNDGSCNLGPLTQTGSSGTNDVQSKYLGCFPTSSDEPSIWQRFGLQPATIQGAMDCLDKCLLNDFSIFAFENPDEPGVECLCSSFSQELLELQYSNRNRCLNSSWMSLASSGLLTYELGSSIGASAYDALQIEYYTIIFPKDDVFYVGDEIVLEGARGCVTERMNSNTTVVEISGKQQYVDTSSIIKAENPTRDCRSSPLPTCSTPSQAMACRVYYSYDISASNLEDQPEVLQSYVSALEDDVSFESCPCRIDSSTTVTSRVDEDDGKLDREVFLSGLWVCIFAIAMVLTICFFYKDCYYYCCALKDEAVLPENRARQWSGLSEFVAPQKKLGPNTSNFKKFSSENTDDGFQYEFGDFWEQTGSNESRYAPDPSSGAAIPLPANLNSLKPGKRDPGNNRLVEP